MENGKILKKFYSSTFSFTKNRNFIIENMKVIKEDLQLRQISINGIVDEELLKMSKDKKSFDGGDYITSKQKMKKDIGKVKYDEVKNEMKEWMFLVKEESSKTEISRLLAIKETNSLEVFKLKKECGVVNKIKSLFSKEERAYLVDVNTRLAFLKNEQRKINKEVQKNLKELKKIKKAKD